MKMTDVQAGETYWYSTRDNWEDWPIVTGIDRHPVRIETVERFQHYTPRVLRPGWTPDEGATPDPQGSFLRGIIPGNPESAYPSLRADRAVYVRPRYLRATLKNARERIEARRKAWQDDADQAARASADHEARAEALTARVAALGLTSALTVQAKYVQALSGLRVTASLRSEGIEALLERLEQAEAREKAAYLAGAVWGDMDEMSSQEEREAAWQEYRAQRG